MNAPWYKHLWPWLLMSGPAIVVVAGLVTAAIAFRTFDGVVVDDRHAPAKPTIMEAKPRGG